MMCTRTVKYIALVGTTLVLVAVGLVPPPALRAYVLSGRHLLALMAEKRTVSQTLEVKQAVSQLPEGDAPRLAAALRETLYFGFPDRFRLLAGTVGAEEGPNRDLRDPDQLSHRGTELVGPSG